MAAKLERFALARTRVFSATPDTQDGWWNRLRPRHGLVPNAIRSPFLDIPPASAPESPPVLLCLGTISPYKQQLQLLRVIRALHSRGLRFAVHFAGSLDAESDYGKEFLHEISMAEAAGCTGISAISDAAAIIARMDAASALVHVPSEEAFGLVVAEALARNLHVFGFSVGGIPDIAGGLEAAESVAPQDWEGLEESIAHWIINGAEKPKKSAGAMRDRYSPEAIAMRHLDIYREVLGSTII